MTIGITGKTGCGKTTLLQEIRKRGALVLDCDEIYHELLRTRKELVDAIEERFPGTVDNGVLDRKKLGRIVFEDAGTLAELNRMTHGAVKAEVQRRLENWEGAAAIDAIALFEGGLAELCDITVAVTAPDDAAAERLMRREGIPRAYALSRIRAQKGEEFFQNRCDFVLCNDGTLEEFQDKCRSFLREIMD